MKTSEVIKKLQIMLEQYGDLPVSISIDLKNCNINNEAKTATSNLLLFSYLQISETKEEISIQNYPY